MVRKVSLTLVITLMMVLAVMVPSAMAKQNPTAEVNIFIIDGAVQHGNHIPGYVQLDCGPRVYTSNGHLNMQQVPVGTHTITAWDSDGCHASIQITVEDKAQNTWWITVTHVPPCPTPTPTVNPTPDPTVDPTPDPTVDPTPTVNPTPDPTVDPTPDPTVDPTPDPTVDPTPASNTGAPVTVATSNPLYYASVIYVDGKPMWLQFNDPETHILYRAPYINLGYTFYWDYPFMAPGPYLGAVQYLSA